MGQGYRDLADASRAIGAFIETVYNRHRLHSALGYRAPEEFETDARNQQEKIPQVVPAGQPGQPGSETL